MSVMESKMKTFRIVMLSKLQDSDFSFAIYVDAMCMSDAIRDASKDYAPNFEVDREQVVEVGKCTTH